MSSNADKFVHTGRFSDRQRGTRQQRGYGAAWDKTRKVILTRDAGLCQPCKRVGILHQGTHVDHIVPKFEGGTDDHDNLQTINAECHASKTAAEAARAAGRQLSVRPACDVSGLPTDPSHPWRMGGGG
jgi:5-methylcytosine-specific restriction endonuclease McrA